MRRRTRSGSGFGGIRVCCLALLALLVAGCATAGNIPLLGGEGSAKIKDGKAVFGKIAVIGGKGPISWKGFSCRETLTFDCPDVFQVYVFPRDAAQPFRHRLNGDGSFYWVRKPGQYTIAGFRFANGAK